MRNCSADRHISEVHFVSVHHLHETKVSKLQEATETKGSSSNVLAEPNVFWAGGVIQGVQLERV